MWVWVQVWGQILGQQYVPQCRCIIHQTLSNTIDSKTCRRGGVMGGQMGVLEILGGWVAKHLLPSRGGGAFLRFWGFPFYPLSAAVLHF